MTTLAVFAANFEFVAASASRKTCVMPFLSGVKVLELWGILSGNHWRRCLTLSLLFFQHEYTTNTIKPEE
jgi:hypothetical protein